ncbi:CHAT domain-containing protein [Cyanobium sp. ATX 6A2]|uniref:CHAT domain-containing tetratricopeptide repeat protein n=1 Tax=Cyanobium sp. ATX 6A2 TaxID=2823700 RepID=UPI0020CD0EC9|nr:CHAT domain-containing tetratricopeptide repeat protein [Cyanobium sp. ATX 6A2]MCP9887849.1 CHAT domain-containing protein [Cyanobium sp. ATX 6A2]
MIDTDGSLAQGQNTVGKTLNHEELETLIKEAGALRDAGRLEEAALVLEELLVLLEGAYGSDHPDIAFFIHSLANLFSQHGLYSQAESLYKRALAIREKALGPDHPDTANSLNNLASLYSDQGLYSLAKPLHKRALAIHEKVLGPDHPGTANTLNNLAYLYSNQGLYSQAEPLYKRALAIREKALGPDHPFTADSLNNLASLYSKQGLYSQAEPLLQRALVIRRKVQGADHPDTANGLNNLAYLYSNQGLYSQAEPLYKRALAIHEKALGPDHPFTASSLNNLAGLYSNQGLYSRAEPLYKRALAIREKALGPDHLDTANSLNNLAYLYSNQGLYSQAEPLYKRALAIREKALGPDHPFTAVSLNNLALLYTKQGLYSQAESLYKRALAIKEKALGPDHPDTALSLNNLGMSYSDQGLYSQAEPLYKRALAIHEKALGPDHPFTAVSLNNLALLYTKQGLYSQAEPLYSRSLAIREQALGPDHPDTALSLNNLGLLNLDADKPDTALRLLSQSMKIEASWLLREATLQPRVYRTALYNTIGVAWEATHSLAGRSEAGPYLALSTRLLRHGLLLEIEQAQASLSRAPGPTRELAQQVAALNNRISDVQLPPERRMALRQQRNGLESHLFRQSPDLQLQRITPEQTAAALPKDGVLVEFQRYRPWQSGANRTKRWGPELYLALTLNPNGAIRAVQLGEAKPIDEAIRQALSASVQGQSDAEERWGEVSSLVLEPLAPHLAGSRQWFFSPDGELHRVPFAALPSPSRPGVPLASAVQLRLLTTGRDLVRFQKPVPSGKPPVVLANPNFDRGRPAPPALIAGTPQSQQRSGDLSNQPWDSLPATAQEGEQVATLLGANPLSGDAATVGVLQRSIGPRVLHIASHGFFVGDQDIPLQDPLTTSFAGGGEVARFQGEDPLLRSGIVLAGANNPDLDPNDDGLLTALEATALQLDGTEMVVLSACSTGSGDIQSGEGLYGLQRALTVAGARSTLLSLWKVDDAATAEFMVRFYRRLKAGEGRADALAAVQAEFRAGEVKGPAGEDWSGTFYWAAWQLVGDWRPIEGL